jgi:glycosyltransferase involved in cell wall biosynthesis
VFLERKKRSFDEKNIRLVYIGSIGPWHSYDKLTAFIKTAYEKIPDSFFKLIISSGAEAMEEFIAANKFRRDRFEIKFVPHREIPEAIKDADIAFFFIPQQYSKIASSPTKMGEMLSAGLPVITGSRIGDVDELVKKNRIGIILEDFDEKAIVNSLSGVIQMCRNEQQALMDRCLETADDYFSLEKGIRKYEEIYATLIQKGA